MKSCSSTLLAVALQLAVVSTSHATIYTTQLTGPNEAPPNASPATGNAIVDFDPLAHTMRVDVTFAGLLSQTTASHIHCCVAPPGTAPVATQLPTFTGFPLGVTAGSYTNSFNTLAAATWNPAFITASGGTAAAAEAALAAGLAAGSSYLNIHTSAFPAGEIRGFLVQAQGAQVPEPGSIALFGVAGAALLALRRRNTRGSMRPRSALPQCVHRL